MAAAKDTRATALPRCPVCGETGQTVPNITVEHQVRPGIGVDEERHFLCRTPECEVAYYTEDGTTTISQDQLTNKIWFKNLPSPKPICYCANVTDEEIIHHVAVIQCCSTLEEIQRHTGANRGCECLTKNPAGG